jgi:hypothetical protein
MPDCEHKRATVYRLRFTDRYNGDGAAVDGRDHAEERVSIAPVRIDHRRDHGLPDLVRATSLPRTAWDTLARFGIC